VEQGRHNNQGSSAGDGTIRPEHGRDAYMCVNEAASFLGIAPGTLRNWVCKAKYGEDPIPFTKFSTRCLRFLKCDLEAWAKRRSLGGR
jgi:hypothetical protein